VQLAVSPTSNIHRIRGIERWGINCTIGGWQAKPRLEGITDEEHFLWVRFAYPLLVQDAYMTPLHVHFFAGVIIDRFKCNNPSKVFSNINIIPSFHMGNMP